MNCSRSAFWHSTILWFMHTWLNLLLQKGPISVQLLFSWYLSSIFKNYLAHFSFQARKITKIHSKKISYTFSKTLSFYFKKWNFLRKTSYISDGNLQSLKNKNFLYFFKKVLWHFGMTADEAVKQKNTSYSRMTAN